MTDVVVVDQRFESEPAKRVLKYQVPLIPDPVEVPIPVGAYLLHTEFVQHGTVADEFGGHWLLWYEVPITDEHGTWVEKPMVFQTMATGIAFPKAAKHLASAVSRDYSFLMPKIHEVWHLYQYPSGAKVVHV